MITSQRAKHWWQGVQSGKTPEYPLVHLSQRGPSTPSTQTHWPVDWSHCGVSMPLGSQSQARHSTSGSPQKSSWHSPQVRPPKPGMHWHCPVNCSQNTDQSWYVSGEACCNLPQSGYMTDVESRHLWCRQQRAPDQYLLPSSSPARGLDSLWHGRISASHFYFHRRTPILGHLWLF